MTKDAEQRKILETMFFSYEFGRAFVLAPEVPGNVSRRCAKPSRIR